MANNQIQIYAAMVDMQVASEAFLNGEAQKISTNTLKDGNNNNSKFPDALATTFSDRYQLIAHQDLTLNADKTISDVIDKSGFSASLFYDTETHQYTLSIRSTEFADSIKDPGDIRGDGVEIADRGWAFAQLSSLEHFYQSVINGTATNGVNGITIPSEVDLATFRTTLNSGGKFNVTGYSLGANLAEGFTELHREKVNQTYLFNGAGTGVPVGGRTFQYLWQKYQAVFDNPFTEYPATGPAIYDDPNVTAALGAYRQNPATTYTNLYDNPKHILALYAIRDMVQGAFDVSNIFGGPTDAPRTPDSQIVDIWTSNYEGDSGADTVVARSGQRHGTSRPIWYEDQPATVWTGIASELFFDYGTGHSIVLLQDSLHLMAAMEKLDPNITEDKLAKIFQSVSNNDYDALEKALDGLGKYFGIDTDVDAANTDGQFADITLRNKFYEKLALIQADSNYIALQGKVKIIAPPTNCSIAKSDFGALLSLVYLTPFVLQLTDDTATDALKAVHQTLADQWDADKSLSAEERAQGKANFTNEYLTDRAAMLSWIVKRNQIDSTATTLDAPNEQLFKDVATNTTIQTGAPPGGVLERRRFLFGASGVDTLEGGARSDRLYGGAGNDTLTGGDGNDHLEGNADADTLLGGEGVDVLLGGSGADLLTGGTDNDLLTGGTGADTYVFHDGGGIDTVLDSGTADKLIWGGNDRGEGGDTLNGGKQVTPGVDAWQSDDDRYGYVLLDEADGSQTLLISRLVNGATAADRIVVKHFTDGAFGITLTDNDTSPAALPAPDTAVVMQPEVLSDGRHVGDRFEVIGTGTDAFHVTGTAYDDVIATTGGSDRLAGAAGRDRIRGEGGQDYIEGGDGLDHLYGGEGDDRLYANTETGIAPAIDAAAETADATDLAELIEGGRGDDLLIGAAGGRNYLHGGGGTDTLIGGGARDVIQGDTYNAGTPGPGQTLSEHLEYDPEKRKFTYYAKLALADEDRYFASLGYPDQEQGAADVIVAGAGNDLAFGEWGNDHMSLGMGDDWGIGGEHDDTIDGEDGNDMLFGDFNWDANAPVGNETAAQMAWYDGIEGIYHGNDTLDGGDGNDLLIGNGRDDLLFGGIGQDRLHGDDELTPGAVHGNDYLDGGADNDLLFGGGKNDELIGGEGADELFGDDQPFILEGQHHGMDVLDGEDGADYLEGGGHDDQLFGGDGNDVLWGDSDKPELTSAFHGKDHLDGQEGDDDLIGGGNDDILIGGTGKDNLFGDSEDASATGQSDGQDILHGDAGDDFLAGGGGDDILLGGEDNDQLQSADGDDTLDGGTGNDVLFGQAGNDRLNGGGDGQDYLNGGEGDDVYVLDDQDGISRTSTGIGDVLTPLGATTIEDTGGVNRVVFGPGVTPASLTLHAIADNGTDFILQYGQDVVHIKNGLISETISAFEFGDGQVLSRADIMALAAESLTLRGGESNADIVGGSHADTIRGGAGADVLNGGAGNDYIDGGIGDDIIEGGRGNDILSGGAGNDTYLFDLGDGLDTLFDFAGNNHVRFGTGLSAASLQASRNYDEDGKIYLDLDFGNGDRLSISQLTQDSTLSFSFSEGGILTINDIFQQVPNQVLEGTSANDHIIGSAGDDSINGWGGDDVIGGGDGNDALNGGNGNDVLQGGFGNDDLSGGHGSDILIGNEGVDTFHFTLGMGHDIVFDGGAELNEIRLGPGVALINLTSQREDNDLLVRLQDDSNSLRIKNYFNRDVQNWHVRYQDGRALPLEDFRQSLASGLDTVEEVIAAFKNTAFNYESSRLIENNGFTLQADGALRRIIDSTTLASNGYVERQIRDSTIRVEFSLFESNEALIHSYANYSVIEDAFSMESSGLSYIRSADLNRRVGFSTTGDSSTPIFIPRALLEAGAGVGYAVPAGSTLVYVKNGAQITGTWIYPQGTFGSTDSAGYSGVGDATAVPSGTVRFTRKEIIGLTETYAGDADNKIVINNGVADGGAGNDFLEGDWGYGPTLLYGNDGNDVLSSFFGDHVLIGGKGQDTLYGWAGANTYRVLNEDSIDFIADRGDDYNSYHDWFYKARTIDDPELDLTREGTWEYHVAGKSAGLPVRSFETYEEAYQFADEYAQNIGKRIDEAFRISHLYSISANALPEINASDYEASEKFYKNGVIRADKIIFGPGVTADNLIVISTRVTDDAGRSTNRMVLLAPDFTGVEFDLPEGPYNKIGAGIEIIEFIDGTQLTIGQVVARAKSNDFLNQTLTGTSGADTLVGGLGNDTVDGGAEADTMSGKRGNDTYIVDDAGDIVIELANEGNDTVQSSLTYTLVANVENLTLTGTAAINGAGNTLNNILIGNAVANTLAGGAGDDTYYVSTGDTVTEGADAGIDIVVSDITWTLGANLENLTLTGAEPINGTGNTLKNVLNGNSGNNVLDGGVGADTMLGGVGNDTYVVENTNDVVTEKAGEGADLVQSSVTYTLTANIENLTLTGTATINGTGNDLDNHLLGNPDSNSLIGEAGSDTLIGGDGVDYVDGSEGVDLLYGGSGNDTVIDWQGGNNLIDGSEGDDSLYGDESANFITGGKDNDYIDSFGIGNVIAFNPGDGIDTIYVGNDLTLSLGGGISIDDLYLSTEGDDLIISIGGTDSIRLEYLFSDYASAERPLLKLQIIDTDIRIYDLNAVIATFETAVEQGASNTNWPMTEALASHILSISLEEAIGGKLAYHYARNGNLEGLETGAIRDILSSVNFGIDAQRIDMESDPDIIVGGSSNDDLHGTNGDDIFAGGAGNDMLAGGLGDDTYLFNAGDGVDHVIDAGGADTIAFGEGITADSLSLGIGSLLVRVGSDGDAIHIEGFDPTNALGSPVIENFTFADGTSLTYEQLLARGFDISGNGMVSGTNLTDRIAGSDDDDTITGGEGNDVLGGAAGNDTYLFNLSDGIDTIHDQAIAGEGNRIVFGTGIARENLQFERNGDALTIRYSDNDAVVLRNFKLFGTDANVVAASVEFADGTAASLAELVDRSPVASSVLVAQATDEDEVFIYQIPPDAFTDADQGDALVLSVTQAGGSALPEWLRFDAATRTLAGTPLNNDVGTMSIKVTATDLLGKTAQQIFDLTVNNINDAPITVRDISAQLATEDQPFSFAVPANAFTDVDAGDTLTYAAALDNGDALPSWLQFDAVTNTFSGTPANADVGTVNLTVTATDGSGAAASGSFSIDVANVNDAPIVISPLADRAAIEDEPFSYVLPADAFTDIDAGDTLTLTARLANGDPLPGWLSFDALTRTFSGAPENNHVGVLAVQVTATDAAGLSAVDVFDLEVVNVNDAPVVANAIVDQPATEDEPFSFTIATDAFVDVDAGDTLILSATLASGDPLPTWLTFDSATQTFSGRPGEDDLGNLSVQVTATDAGGLTVASIFNLNVAIAPDRTLTGTDHADTLVGASGNDTLDGAGGADLLIGKRGNDAYMVDHTDDVIVEKAAEGIDTVRSSTTWTLGAHLENLTLTGAALDGFGNELGNVIVGNAGSNTLDGGMGADSLIGGKGDDLYFVEDDGDTVHESVDEGSDTVISSIDTLLSGNTENLILTGAAIRGAGNGLDNLLIGNALNNTLFGEAGDDTLDGDVGADAMTGGDGNDTYTIDHADDRVIETLYGGSDTVRSSISYFLGGEVENLVLTGNGNLTGIGNALDNILTGNSGNNLLNGYEGSDILAGHAGDDIYFVDHTNDIVIEQTDGGIDTVHASVSYTLSDHVENLILEGASDINATGNMLDNVLTGNQGNNLLDTGNGNDILIGDMGDDDLQGGLGDDAYTYNVGDGFDRISDMEGTDTVRLGAGLTLDNIALRIATVNGQQTAQVRILGPDGSEQSDQGFDFAVTVDNNGQIVSPIEHFALNDGQQLVFNDLLIRQTFIAGSNKSDTVTGGRNDDTLAGGNGSDTLDGGTGNDILYGDNGADMIYGAGGNDAVHAGNDSDYVYAGSGDDRIRADNGNDVIQVGTGNDVVDTGNGNDLVDGGNGNDVITTGNGRDWIAGGKGNDMIDAGFDRNLFAFNRGDGADTIRNSRNGKDTISIGMGVRYADLTLAKSGTDLVFGVGEDESITLKDWYVNPGNQGVGRLQMVTAADGGDYDAASSDKTKNRKVELYDFGKLVQRFDAVRNATPAINQWAMMNGLLEAHLSGSDTAAIGADLSYQYAVAGNLTGVGLGIAGDILSSGNFNSTTPQALQSRTQLEQGLVKLG
jgi:Ca2+-binding RTX toxin-like protein